MRRWWRTGATLLFGAGLGASLTRLQRPEGGEEEEEDGLGLLSRVPVVPVPRVQASELTVRLCVCVSFQTVRVWNILHQTFSSYVALLEMQRILANLITIQRRNFIDSLCVLIKFRQL